MRNILKIATMITLAPCISLAGEFQTGNVNESADNLVASLEALYTGSNIVLPRANSSLSDANVVIDAAPNAAVTDSIAKLEDVKEVEQKELTKSGSTFSFTNTDSVTVGLTPAEVEIELLFIRGFVAVEFYGSNNRTVDDVQPATNDGFGKVGSFINVLIEDITYVNGLAVTFAQSNDAVDWQTFDPAATRAGENLTKLNNLVEVIEDTISKSTKEG